MQVRLLEHISEMGWLRLAVIIPNMPLIGTTKVVFIVSGLLLFLHPDGEECSSWKDTF